MILLKPVVWIFSSLIIVVGLIANSFVICGFSNIITYFGPAIVTIGTIGIFVMQLLNSNR